MKNFQRAMATLALGALTAAALAQTDRPQPRTQDPQAQQRDQQKKQQDQARDQQADHDTGWLTLNAQRMQDALRSTKTVAEAVRTAESDTNGKAICVKFCPDGDQSAKAGMTNQAGNQPGNQPGMDDRDPNRPENRDPNRPGNQGAAAAKQNDQAIFYVCVIADGAFHKIELDANTGQITNRQNEGATIRERTQFMSMTDKNAKDSGWQTRNAQAMLTQLKTDKSLADALASAERHTQGKAVFGAYCPEGDKHVTGGIDAFQVQPPTDPQKPQTDRPGQTERDKTQLGGAGQPIFYVAVVKDGRFHCVKVAADSGQVIDVQDKGDQVRVRTETSKTPA